MFICIHKHSSSLLNFAVVIYVPINLGLHSFYHARILFFSWKSFLIVISKSSMHTRASFAFAITFVLEFELVLLFFIVVGVGVGATLKPITFRINLCKQRMNVWHVADIFAFQKSVVVKPYHAKYPFIKIYFMSMCVYELID